MLEMSVIMHEYFYMKFQYGWHSRMRFQALVYQPHAHEHNNDSGPYACMYNKTKFTRTQSACEVAPLSPVAIDFVKSIAVRSHLIRSCMF